jgi:hypothetical protein
LFTQIVDKLTVDLGLSIFHDGYEERIEDMVKSKMKGELHRRWRRGQRGRWPQSPINVRRFSNCRNNTEDAEKYEYPQIPAGLFGHIPLTGYE